MTKLEEIYRKSWERKFPFPYLDTLEIDHIHNAMKEYSEFYAKKCLEIAASEADVIEYGGRGCHVDKNSILNIKLPSHEEAE